MVFGPVWPSFSQEPEKKKPDGNITAPGASVEISDDEDTVMVTLKGITVQVIEDKDSVTVRLGNRVLTVNDEGEVHYGCCEGKRFNGHWAGFDIGFNGYVTPEFTMDFPREYEYLDLRMEKSIAVNINFFEQNIPFSKKNKHWGMVTGLGLNFNDYRFLRPTRLSMDSSYLMGYLDQGIEIRKSKLSVFYLALPVLFEYQTNGCHRKNSFHVNAGVVLSARLRSHTKKFYDELNKEFNVTQYNPSAGDYETVFTAISPNENKTHDYDDWFLRPFKADATLRVGWGVINLFATVSLNTLFRDNKGPELYPWSAGITLLNF